MMNIIVVFPKMEQAKSIKHILIKGGFSVKGMCTSGANALLLANELGDGILVCASRLTDMNYQELYEDLPCHFQMLLLASPNVLSQRETEDIMCLSMPLKVHELLHTVEMMEYDLARKKRKRRQAPKQRNQEEQELVSQAKELLMARNSLTEEEAHRYIQKSSMDSGTGFVETAQMILSMLQW